MSEEETGQKPEARRSCPRSAKADRIKDDSVARLAGEEDPAQPNKDIDAPVAPLGQVGWLSQLIRSSLVYFSLFCSHFCSKVTAIGKTRSVCSHLAVALLLAIESATNEWFC